MSYQRGFIEAVLPAEIIGGQAMMEQGREHGHQSPLKPTWVHLLVCVTRASQIPQGVEVLLGDLGGSAARQDQGSNSGVCEFEDVGC